MFAGTLRHLVRVETPIETPDGAGGSTTTWTLVCETRAAITPLAGRERVQAQAINAETTHAVTTRYRAEITSKCRIVYGARVFRITAPPRDVEERHRELAIDCAEVLSEATS